MITLNVEEISSNDARDTIVAQHDVLRELLAQTLAAAEASSEPLSIDRREAVREATRSFYETLTSHASFEDALLEPALRDLIGLGPTLHHEIEASHERQRRALALVLAQNGPTCPSCDELLGQLRSFAGALLADIDLEERGLLQADLDALTADIAGG